MATPMPPEETYAARLEIDYPPGELDRVTTAFRIIWIIPILIIVGLLGGAAGAIGSFGGGAGRAGGSAGGSLFLATALMIIFRQKYPHWWFAFLRELARFEHRVGAYAALLTDVYPSTVDEQVVHHQHAVALLGEGGELRGLVAGHGEGLLDEGVDGRAHV